MHIDELMKNYKPLYPDSGQWEDTFKMIDEDPIDSQIAKELCDELEKNGEFRKPITLTTYEGYLQANKEYKHLEGESPDPYVPHVNNGTHRIYAHYLSTKHKEVKIQHGWEPEVDEEYPFIASKVALPPDLEEETLYELWDRFYSFKLTDGIWMEGELISLTDNNFHILWCFGVKNVEEILPYMELITSTLLEFTSQKGIICTAKTGIINSEDEDELFFERK